jgi:polysaccharide pyruvyl transferase WcaK-like protein
VRVLTVGPHGGFNRGDELILRCVISDLRALGHSVTAMSADPMATERQHGVPAVRAPDLKRARFGELRAIRGFDAVVVAGGEQVQDGRYGNFGWGLLPTLAHVVRHATAVDVPVMLWALGASQLHSPVLRLMFRRWVGLARAATARDDASASWFRRYGFPDDRLSLAADPVFALDREDHRTARAFARRQLGVTDDAELIVYAPANDLRGPTRYVDAWADVLRADVKQRGARVVLLLMDRQRAYDQRLLERASLRADGLLAHLDGAMSDADLIRTIAGADLVVGARMHALIIAATQGTPFLALGRSAKVTAVARDLGAPTIGTDVVDRAALTESLTSARRLSREGWQSRVDPVLALFRARAGLSRAVFIEAMAPR